MPNTDAILKKELDALEARWLRFLSQLEQKHDEITTALEAEGPSVYAEDADPFKRAFIRFKSDMEGQLSHIRHKASDTADTQIRATYDARNPGVLHPAHDTLYAWRERCLQAHYAWEERLSAKRDQALASLDLLEDPELQYQAILAEYERIKHGLTCRQCGAGLTLDTIYFVATYVSCPHCQAQNTFEPSVQARQLEHIARPLAEKRHRKLYEEYQQSIYQGRHDDPAARQAGLEKEYAAYKTYLRAVFDEMHSIVPDLKAQNEKFYERLLADHRRHHSL